METKKQSKWCSRLISKLAGTFFWGLYRPRVIDRANVPEKGGVLFVCNRESTLDPLLLSQCSGRRLRFVVPVYSEKDRFPDSIAFGKETIYFSPDDPNSVEEMDRTVLEGLEQGEAIVIFPEGDLTRTEQLSPFRPEYGQVIENCGDYPIIPVYIGGFWGSMFSKARPLGTPVRPVRLLRRATIAFGEPIRSPKGIWSVYARLEELGVDAMMPGRFPEDRQLYIFSRWTLRNCRQFGRQDRIADTTGMNLTGKGTILRILIVRHVLRRYLGKDEKNVGILLPTSVGDILANAALVFDHRVPINLNYTFSNETNNYCIHKVGIKHVLTSKKFFQKLPHLEKLDTQFLFLEDLLRNVPRSAKIQGLLESLLPTCLLERWLGLTRKKPDEINSIIFTSGATGEPKGVMLSESNIASNVLGFMQVLNFDVSDRHFGVLPLFHSFGYTTSMWGSLCLPIRGFYHVNPLESKLVGELAQKQDITVLTMTPTFARNYFRRCPGESFKMVNAAIPGAEKLAPDLAQGWREKYGHSLSEGFGMTELAPVLAVNIPEARLPDPYIPYRKEGSIGRPCPGFAVRIVDPDTGEILPPNQQGMMEVKGASVMRGYFEDPEKTRASFHDGWLSTGDIALRDTEGFIFITGRLTRMAKLGGEMVPLVFVEEKIVKILTDLEKEKGELSDKQETENGVQLAVTSVPDEKKGEKIVVLYTDLALSPEEICRLLLDADLPQLWIPSPVNFRKVEKIPLLGSGKLDLRGIKKVALDLYS